MAPSPPVRAAPEMTLLASPVYADIVFWSASERLLNRWQSNRGNSPEKRAVLKLAGGV